MKHSLITAKLETTSYSGRTALHWSIHCLELSFAELLLSRSANVNASDEDGNAPLHNAISKTELLKLLLDHGAAVDVANWDENTPLILCSRSSRAGPSVRLLLGSGADINKQGSMGETQLCGAIKNRRSQMIKILLAEGADP